MAELKFVIHICRDGVNEETPIEVPFKKGTYVKVLRPKGKSEVGDFYEMIDGVTFDGSRFTATP